MPRIEVEEAHDEVCPRQRSTNLRANERRTNARTDSVGRQQRREENAVGTADEYENLCADRVRVDERDFLRKSSVSAREEAARDAHRKRLDRQKDRADQQVICGLVSEESRGDRGELTGAEGKDAEAHDVKRDLPLGPVTECEDKLKGDWGWRDQLGWVRRVERSHVSQRRSIGERDSPSA